LAVFARFACPFWEWATDRPTNYKPTCLFDEATVMQIEWLL